MIIIQSNSNSTGLNLSIEDYLFTQRKEEFLFLYVNEPSVVMGHNQRLLSEVNSQFCAENNIPVYRRMSGGGTVFHDLGNLNYCFISNRIEGDSPLNDHFLQVIVDVLKDLHIEAHIGKRKDLWLPGGYKISGTASHITKKRELHHGTLLYDTNLDKLEKSLSSQAEKSEISKVASVHSPVKNIRAYLVDQKYMDQEACVFFRLVTDKLLHLYSLGSVAGLSDEEMSLIKPLEPIFK